MSEHADIVRVERPGPHTLHEERIRTLEKQVQELRVTVDMLLERDRRLAKMSKAVSVSLGDLMKKLADDGA